MVRQQEKRTKRSKGSGQEIQLLNHRISRKRALNKTQEEAVIKEVLQEKFPEPKDMNQKIEMTHRNICKREKITPKAHRDISEPFGLPHKGISKKWVSEQHQISHVRFLSALETRSRTRKLRQHRIQQTRNPTQENSKENVKVMNESDRI